MKQILIYALTIAGLAVGATTSHAQVVERFTGEVLSLQVEERKITVREEGGFETNEYQVPEGTEILKDEEQIRLRDLKRGDIIKARFVTDTTGRVLTNSDYIETAEDKAEEAKKAAEAEAERIAAEAERAREAAEAEPMRLAALEEEKLPTTLPKTASSLPLYGALGLLFLTFAGAIRFARVRK